MGLFGRAQRPAHGEALENSVGPSSSFKGTLRSDGGARIDGSFEGLIEVAGNVVVGRDGRVIGDIAARNVTVGGVVRGNIDGTGQLQILSTGQVFGDIAVASVMIDEGGMFQGLSRLRGFEQPALAPPRDDESAAGDERTARSGAAGRTIESTARLAPARVATSTPRERTAAEAQQAPPAEAAPGEKTPRKPAGGKAGAKARGRAGEEPVTEPPEAEAGPVEPPAQAEPAGSAATGARAPEYDLDLDFGGLDIEPVIPDVFIEEPSEDAEQPEDTADRAAGVAADGDAPDPTPDPTPAPPARRARSARTGNRRGR